MSTEYGTRNWRIQIPSPWRVVDLGYCLEIAQPEGLGTLRLSAATKKKSSAPDADTLAEAQEHCPAEAAIQPVVCGAFTGHLGEYYDWNASLYWHKWFLNGGRVHLFVTYIHKQADTEYEFPDVRQLLGSLEYRT